MWRVSQAEDGAEGKGEGEGEDEGEGEGEAMSFRNDSLKVCQCLSAVKKCRCCLAHLPVCPLPR